MARGIDKGPDFTPRERGRLFSKIFSQTIPGALTLALSALFGVWILYLRPAAAPYAVEAPAAAPAVALASNPYGGLFDSRSSSGSTPVSLAKNFPLELNLKPVPPAPSAAIAEPEHVLPALAGAQFGESAPLPVSPPTELGSLESHSPFPASGRRLAQQNRRTAPPLRSLSLPMQRRKMAFLAMHEVSHPARRPAMIDGPRFTMSRRIPSTCPMERDWKRIRASTTGWTIRVTSTNECAGRRRRMSMSLRRGSSFSTESKRCASNPLAAVTSMDGPAFSHTPTCSARTVIRTDVCPSGTTTHFCRPFKMARLNVWSSSLV